MIFRICDHMERILCPRNMVRLQVDNWDDFRFKTSLYATYFDSLGREFKLGIVKIGMAGMGPGWIREQLDGEFVRLPEGFFSLGQSEDYYEAVARRGDGFRREMLSSLRDAAFDAELFQKYRDEPVMLRSLLRDVTAFEVSGQFRRMALGGARLTRYAFTYRSPGDDPLELSFEVEPQTEPPSGPPTNVHALIGRNGCGKTYLIRSMVRCFQHRQGTYGRLHYHDPQGQGAEFANVLCIAFSPFDDFSDLILEDSTIPAVFVGLNKRAEEKGWDLLEDIWTQFWRHFENCLIAERKRKLWREAIGILRSDPTFREENIGSFMDDCEHYSGKKVDENAKRRIRAVFSGLSSGHKVVLLIVTSCVAEIEERSVVFLDEPENHLHPPLLSALIRALSNLLMDRNGMAIVSTHSPVVLQEVPRSCVWKLDRRHAPRRLGQETFGATIGGLTDEVFRLDAEDSGFHKILKDRVRSMEPVASPGDAVSAQADFRRILEGFGNQLGDEARMLLWSLVADRREE